MNMICFDLEGVLVPEIWIAFSEVSGIPELRRTTRDEPDYDLLMNWRIGILREHGLGLKEIQNTIAKIDPLPGAKEFLDELRSFTQAVIISDTFSQFAGPLMKKLGYPTIFCNSLEVAENGEITGCIVEGPISYDIALSKEIAEFKGFDSPVAGDADVVIMPNMTAGNILGKSWSITAGGMMAGMIVGAKVPIVLTSRGATAAEKFYSIVFAAAGSK